MFLGNNLEDWQKKAIFAKKRKKEEMDLFKIPRELIYKERRSLEDFAAEDEVNALFIDNMLNTIYFSSADAKDRALRCFNTAYYICTLIQMCKNRPEWNFAIYCDIAFCNVNGNGVYQAFTLSLVAIFLKHAYKKATSEKLGKKLYDFLISHFIGEFDPIGGNYYYIDAYHDLLKDAPEDLLIAEEFAPRKIDRDIFRDVDGHGNNWNTFTNYYQKDEVRKFVDMLGKDEEEKYVLIELIDRDAQRFYGSDGAPYIQNVKPMLEEMNECLYHEYNDSDIQAIAEAEIELLQYQGDVRPLQAKIVKLEKEIAYLKGLQPDEYATDDEVKEPDDSLQQQLADARKNIEELNLAIQSYKDQGKGLSAPEAAMVLTAICLELNQIPSNGREGLAPIIEYCWGKSNSTAAEALRRKVTEQSANKLAEFFEDITPKLARLIRELPQQLKKNKHERLLKINPKC